jgi:hypothetical protein
MAPSQQQQQPTVLSLKQSFLTAQTRLLSQPLTPTRAWHNTNTNTNTNNANESNEETTPALPPKAVDDALFKLNHRLQQHARRAYAPQATRHVAEQIEQLYWNAAEEAQRGEEGEEVLEEGGLGLEDVGGAVDDDDGGGGGGGRRVERDAALRVGADLGR